MLLRKALKRQPDRNLVILAAAIGRSNLIAAAPILRLLLDTAGRWHLTSSASLTSVNEKSAIWSARVPAKWRKGMDRMPNLVRIKKVLSERRGDRRHFALTVHRAVLAETFAAEIHSLRLRSFLTGLLSLFNSLHPPRARGR